IPHHFPQNRAAVSGQIHAAAAAAAAAAEDDAAVPSFRPPVSPSVEPSHRDWLRGIVLTRSGNPKERLLPMKTICGSLMHELQVIWDEVGEPEAARDRMLLELEQECLEVYRRKVDQANRSRAQLRQAIAQYEAELAAICSAIGETTVHVRQSNQKACGLRDELGAILPYLEEMKRKKVERWNQFLDVVGRIKKISSEIRPANFDPFKVSVDQSDLSLRKLEELRVELKSLEKEKGERVKQVMEYLKTLHSLCVVLGVDFKKTISEIHPSLDEAEGPRNISNTTIEMLAWAIQRLRETKMQRMQKLQDLASTLLELWNLMDTPFEEQQAYQNITCNIAASEAELTEQNTLSIEFLNYVEAEVLRLEQHKASKMKELVLKKKTELEEHRRRAHLVGEEGYATQFTIEAIEAGAIDPSLLLEQIEAYISTVKEEAFSRKDILERVEKWLNAREEEAWLEDYNKDDNRYNAGRGAHIMLKRAEKARVLVSKIPGMVDVLETKTRAWETERGNEFTYDGVRLILMLEEYMVVRQEKEQERKRQRDQKKLQDQRKAEQEALYGSKPSSSKSHSTKKVPRNSTPGVQPPKSEILHSKTIRATKKTEDINTPSPGHKGLDTVGLPIRKLFPSSNSSTLLEMETPRKPFSQITPGNISSAPVRPISTGGTEENRTPKTFAPVPTTPMTVSPHMQMAVTPVLTAKAVSVLSYDEPELTSQEDTEYSFEEKRLAVYLAAQVA
ncbi:Os05g0552900, partial [Oryza sativa Japonica Group]